MDNSIRSWYAIPRRFGFTGEVRQSLHGAGVTEAGLKYIERQLKEGSSRNPTQNRASVVVRLPNPTTGTMSVCESEGEFAFGESKLSDPSTRLMVSQPEALRLSYTSETGRRKTYPKTYDFLLLDDEFQGIIECKTEAELVVLAAHDPACWQRTEFGWECPPGEEAARKLGLHFKVVTEADVNHVKLANFRLLEEYFDKRAPILTDAEVALLPAHFSDAPYRTLESLQEDESVSIDDVFIAITQGHLLCDLGGTRLDQPAECPVFLELAYLETYLATLPGRSPIAEAVECTVLQPGSRIVWSSTAFTALAVEPDKALLCREDGSLLEMSVDQIFRLKEEGKLSVEGTAALSEARALALEMISAASASSRATMLRRHPIVLAALRKEPIPEPIPPRTLAGWVSDYRQADAHYGLGIVGLLPGHSGNFSPRFPKRTWEIFFETKKDIWDGNEERTRTAFYSVFQSRCEAEGVPWPCSKTASKWLDEAETKEERDKNRRGAAEAYMSQPFYFWLEYRTPRHGMYPWHIVHIDHTKIDVEVRLSNGRTGSRRAYLTLAVDAYSRRVLAALLLWDPPSHRTCMLVIRQLIKRHGRIPNTIVVDGGSEFRSVEFELLLATLNIKKKTRPGKKPRAGSVIERIFGVTDKEFLHSLRGNTQATKRDVRTVTPETDPKANAVWNLPGLQIAAEHYFHVTYDGHDHSGLGMKPSEAYAQGIARWGAREHLRWSFTPGLEIVTMPSTPRGVAKVVPGRGVKINYTYYWSEVFRDGKVENKSVPVKYDPYDGSRAWAKVAGKWHQLTSQDSHLFAGLSVRARAILTDRLREDARVSGRRIVANAQSMADMLRRVGEAEDFLIQSAQDDDQLTILQLIFGADSLSGSASRRPDTAKRASPDPAPSSKTPNPQPKEAPPSAPRPAPRQPPKVFAVLEDLP